MSSKLREALSDACYAMFNFLKTQNGGYEEMAKALDKTKAALAEPLRNCDVGSAEEQEERFHAFCNRHTVVDAQHCNGCPINNIQTEADCVFVWAQLPYDETKGENK